MMKSPAGRYPFSRFMASPSRAKRSELEHDNFASTLPGSIGGEVVVANMDGPDPDSGTCWECSWAWGASPWPPNRHPCSEAEPFEPYNLAAPVGGFHSGLSIEIGVRHRGHDLRCKRMRLRGLSGARDEFHLAAIVQNLKTL